MSSATIDSEIEHYVVILLLITDERRTIEGSYKELRSWGSTVTVENRKSNNATKRLKKKIENKF